MVHAEEVEDGGPEVIDSLHLLHGVVAEVVGFAESHAATHAAACHPDAEAVGIVVASVAALGEESAAEFASPDDERAVEQAAGFEVFDEARDGLVHLPSHVAMAFLDLSMLIPGVRGLAAAELLGEAAQLDEAHAALDETARQQALHAVGFAGAVGTVHAVEFLGGFGFAREIAEVGHGGLHAPGHLVVLNGGLDLAMRAEFTEEVLIEFTDEIEAAALKGGGLARADVADGFGLVHADDGGLMLGGQEAVAEQSHTAVWSQCATALQHHITWDVARFGAEAITGPCSSAWVTEEGETSVHEKVPLRMLAELRGHAADDAEFVGHGGHVREELADRKVRLAVALKFPVRRLHYAVVVELGACGGHGWWFASVFL